MNYNPWFYDLTPSKLKTDVQLRKSRKPKKSKPTKPTQPTIPEESQFVEKVSPRPSSSKSKSNRRSSSKYGSSSKHNSLPKSRSTLHSDLTSQIFGTDFKFTYQGFVKGSAKERSIQNKEMRLRLLYPEDYEGIKIPYDENGDKPHPSHRFPNPLDQMQGPRDIGKVVEELNSQNLKQCIVEELKFFVLKRTYTMKVSDVKVMDPNALSKILDEFRQRGKDRAIGKRGHDKAFEKKAKRTEKHRVYNGGLVRPKVSIDIYKGVVFSLILFKTYL